MQAWLEALNRWLVSWCQVFHSLQLRGESWCRIDFGSIQAVVPMKDNGVWYCDFCGLNHFEVRSIFRGGGGAAICSHCTTIAMKALADGDAGLRGTESSHLAAIASAVDHPRFIINRTLVVVAPNRPFLKWLSLLDPQTAARLTLLSRHC
ncbi:ClpX C4-type zinc finger protein [Ralstonia pseudosolanacearum]|uniref:ClpX C4-type zinc finger protein n=1 Tax=Ralstonia pseudosolanacearum TaxID=1310165 RepID=UPI001FF9D32D|nr:ClpX C4-type zinc finger protein [Ralstonia pseudosolanacearum]